MNLAKFFLLLVSIYCIGPLFGQSDADTDPEINYHHLIEGTGWATSYVAPAEEDFLAGEDRDPFTFIIGGGSVGQTADPDLANLIFRPLSPRFQSQRPLPRVRLRFGGS